MVKTIIVTKPGEMLKARLNQPRVSSEYLRQQEERHRQASEEFFKAARNAISKRGQRKPVSGASS
jgi:hypothetical protein